MHHRVRGIWSAILLAAALGPSAAAGLDLTGKWRFQPTGGFVFGSPQIVQVTQSGSSLSFNFSVFPFTGTVTTGGPFATYTVDASGAFLSEITGRIMPSENLLDGRVLTAEPPDPFVLVGGMLATRCTCDDGNTVNGDGCDDRCEVEPCWTCSGDPSVCTPASDGSACEDGSPCTTAQTCSAGACGGGTPVSPCTDMSGVWRRHREIPDLAQTSDFVTSFSQRGTDVIAESYVGTIDPATGAFDLRTFNPSKWCVPFDPLLGSVDSSGTTYTASGSIELPNESAPDTCDSFSLTETGTRCGAGTVEPGELCDDGNAIDGDGCSAGCAVEPCWGCTGQPSICVPTPHTPCKGSTAPNKSLLSINHGLDDTTDKITWLWKKGAATTTGELGNPAGSDGYVLCVYDQSTMPPGLLFRATLPGGGSCDGAPCWKAKGSTGFGYKNSAAMPQGVTLTRLKSGAAGAAKALLKGKGVHLSDRPFGLPAPLLPTPLRVQLLGDSGLCLETTHSAAGVVKNDAASGVFKARGTP